MEKQTKKPTMEVVGENQQKLTYEQLNNACINLSQQNQQLMQHNRELLNQLNQIGNMYRRLDYLFAVLQHEKVINDTEFIGMCVDEIKGLMTLPPKEEDKSTGEVSRE